jgi:hypothetical protein
MHTLTRSDFLLRRWIIWRSKMCRGRWLVLDYWGGYLIYRLYPRVRMVVDDRHDFYGEEFLKSYLEDGPREPGWEDFLQQHQAHCVVVPKDSALANILLETPGWQPDLQRRYGGHVCAPSHRLSVASRAAGCRRYLLNSPRAAPHSPRMHPLRRTFLRRPPSNRLPERWRHSLRAVRSREH